MRTLQKKKKNLQAAPLSLSITNEIQTSGTPSLLMSTIISTASWTRVYMACICRRVGRRKEEGEGRERRNRSRRLSQWYLKSLNIQTVIPNKDAQAQSRVLDSIAQLKTRIRFCGSYPPCASESQEQRATG